MWKRPSVMTYSTIQQPHRKILDRNAITFTEKHMQGQSLSYKRCETVANRFIRNSVTLERASSVKERDKLQMLKSKCVIFMKGFCSWFNTFTDTFRFPGEKRHERHFLFIYGIFTTKSIFGWVDMVTDDKCAQGADE